MPNRRNDWGHSNSVFVSVCQNLSMQKHTRKVISETLGSFNTILLNFLFAGIQSTIFYSLTITNGLRVFGIL